MERDDWTRASVSNDPTAEAAAADSACIGCGATAGAERCDHCGAAQAPGGLRVVRLISESFHGRVYEALDGDARVAVKELVFARVPDVATLDAFEREARVLGQLAHPQIPRVLRTFRAGEGVHTRLYLVEELIEGETLLRRVQREPLAEPEARRVAGQVLDVLDYLHARTPKVLHRDLKPANLMRRPDGTIALVDFGSARDLVRTVTHGATLVGTFGYMPPEQLGGTVDETSDLYALGATLVHLLSGRSPAELLTPDLELAFEPHVNVSPGLARLLRRLTARERTKRFSTARKARDELRQLENVPPGNSRWWRPARVRVAVAAAAATLALAVTVALAFRADRTVGNPVPSRAAVDDPRAGAAGRATSSSLGRGAMGVPAQAAVVTELSPALARLPHLDAMVRDLRHGNEGARLRALGAMRGLTEYLSRDAVGELVATLDDPSLEVQLQVIEILGDVRPSPAVDNALTHAAHEPGEPARRVGALAALVRQSRGRSAPDRVRAVRTLAMLATEDGSDIVRAEAAFGLGELAAPPGETELRALRSLIADPSADVRVAAIRGFASQPGVVERVVPMLRGALGDPAPRVRAAAAYALGRAGPAAFLATPQLAAALGDSEAGVREAAVRALGAIGPDAHAALPALEAYRASDGAGTSEANVALARIRGTP